MFTYIAVRLVGAVLTFWVTITLTFFGLRVAFARFGPGSSLFGPNAAPAQVYTFDGSPVDQYLSFLGSALRWDWGYSVSASQDVGEVLRDGFPVTAKIGLLSFLLAVALGVPLGALAAGRRGRIDRVVSSGATFAYAFPGIVLAILLYVFSVRTISAFDVFDVGFQNGGGWRDYLLPVVVLGLGAGGYLTRVTRAAVLAVLSQDYVRTARAKGMPKGTITRRHVIPNALPVMLAALGPTLGILLSGSALLELVLNVPGTGKLLLSGFPWYDYPLILAGVSLYTALVLAANLAADVAARLVNVRAMGAASARIFGEVRRGH